MTPNPTPKPQDNQEELILSFFLQNPNDYYMVSDRMHKDVFTTEPWVRVWPPLYQAFKDNRTFPSPEEIPTLLRKLDADILTKTMLAGRVQKLYQLDVSAYTGQEALQWIALQEIVRLGNACSGAGHSKHTLLEQVTHHRERLDKIEMLLSGGKSLGEIIRPYSDESLDNWKQAVEDEYGARPITTGFKRLDRKLRGNGVRPTLMLIVAPTGGGKSSVLLHMARANTRQGNRSLIYMLDDNAGEILERNLAGLIQRPTTFEDVENPAGVSIVAKHRRDLEFPGDFCCVPIQPDKWMPQDIIRDIAQKQKHFYELDKKRTTEEGWDIPEEEWGRIELIGIDTADQIRSSTPKQNAVWFDMEKLFSELSFIPKKFKCVLACTVQGNQETVGASQITLRNTGGSYGKNKPAKLIIGIAQTNAQSQQRVTRDWTAPCWQQNKDALWNVNFQADRDTEWEPAYLCIIKNTAASGEPGAGLVKNVQLPLLINFASSRIVEDFSLSEELMRQDSKTAREDKEAYGSTGGGRQVSPPPRATGKSGPK